MQPTQQKGMPSILGDTPPPFSSQPRYGLSPDFDTAYDAWKKTPDPTTNTQLLKTVQPVIDTALSSYAPTAGPALKSRAKLLALQAMQTFDPERGSAKTHLLTHLQRLRRLGAQEQNIVRIPEQVGLDFQKLTAAENELKDALSRDPTDDEVADFTGLSTRRIRKIRAFNQPISEGMTADRRKTDGDDLGDVASNLPQNNKSYEAWLSFVYDDLTPTDKLIMDMSLGRNGRRRASTQDIARRLNITPGAVSQRAAKIQNMIDRRFSHNF